VNIKIFLSSDWLASAGLHVREDAGFRGWEHGKSWFLAGRRVPGDSQTGQLRAF